MQSKKKKIRWHNMNMKIDLVKQQEVVFHPQSDLTVLNELFKDATPSDVMGFVARNANNPVIFTNFRPMAVAVLHLVTKFLPNIKVVWVDHGFNTPETYRHVERVVASLNLNLQVYSPKMSAAHYTSVHGDIPPLDTPEHDHFTDIVKLEPFKRAMSEIQPDVWLNGIRHSQDSHRGNLDVFTFGSHNTVRVAPMFHFDEMDVEEYIFDRELPDNEDYFDPTKGETHRECGLMLQA